MKSAPYVAGIAILVILAGAVGLAFSNRQHSTAQPVTVTATSTTDTTNQPNDTTTQPEPTQTGTTVSDMIHITLPINNQIVGKTLEIKGEARGNWYFEASFPGRVEDANGKVLVQFSVAAKGDWMTTDFVQFDQKIKISTSTTATGKLILEKDNPSGLPQNAMQIVIPIKFATTTSS